jgi:formate hydrogenlyase subunit 3/multisubunit Na+/H+ antiporter MnhD subunit
MLAAVPQGDASPVQGFLLVLAIVLPIAGVLLAGVFGRGAEWIALAIVPSGLVLALAIFVDVSRHGSAMSYLLGSWTPPLGIALRADGLSATMLLVTAVVISATALFARPDFAMGDGPERRVPFAFWTLLLALWAALNMVFLGSDLFTLYVALELLTFAAVPLISLKGGAEHITAALRYLLFALTGSALYLLGTALLYGAYGTLDIVLLSQRTQSDTITWTAAALMVAGLLAKTALFPLHFWLPPAHAGAPAAASAVLSALVVKAPFFLIVRLSFDAMPTIPTQEAAQLLGALGAMAILFGSVLALRQARLKMLIAYSTVAQIGYLFLMFPLLVGGDVSQPSSNVAWTGGWMQLISHAFAKAAMFMAAGLIAEEIGHDRIDDLDGLGSLMPITVLTFGLAGISLMGVPPSGGFVAKWLLLSAAATAGQWWWIVVILLGGLIAGAYVFRVLMRAMSDARAAVIGRRTVSRLREAVPLALAVSAIVLGLIPLEPLAVLAAGRLEIAGSTLP